MKKLSQIDLTKGKPWQAILLFSLPIILANLISQLYSLADGMMIGHVMGGTAFAAIGLAGNITYIATALASGLPSGTAGFTAQLYGAKNHDDVRKSYAATLFICLIGGIAVTIIMMFLVDPLLAAVKLTAADEVYPYAKLYVYIIFGGLTGIFFYNMYLNFLRSLGDSAVPFLLGLIYALLNTLLDFLFIVVAKWGVVGAAAAFDASVCITSLIGALWVYMKYPWLRLSKNDFLFPKGFIKEHLRLGLPMAILFCIIGIGCLIMQGAINSYGQDCINGFSCAGRLENFLSVTVCGFGSAMVAFTGQNYGAKQYKRVKQGLIDGLIIVAIDCAIKILITFFLLDVTCSIFIDSPNEETKQYCRIYMYWDMATYIFLALIYVCRNVLLGIGKIIPEFISGVAELVGRVTSAKGLVRLFGANAALGAPGVAWILSAVVLLGACIKTIFKDKRFQNNEVVLETAQPVLK
jgi:putative MATE family efflux protein